jgi:hypothetical protein
VRVEKGGTLRTVEVSCAIAVARRLCAHPEVPDRRGVARGPVGGAPSRAPRTRSFSSHSRPRTGRAHRHRAIAPPRAPHRRRARPSIGMMSPSC